MLGDQMSNSAVPSLPCIDAIGGAPLYVTGEDALCLTVFNAAAGAIVTVSGRMQQLGEARPKPFSQTLTPATDRSASTVRFAIGEGWLLNAQAIVTGGTPAIGQTFARLSLCHGTTTNALELFTMAAGYVTAKMPLSYPGSGVLASVEGAGALRAIVGSTPGVGAEISETVPTGARWELVALVAQLTASATVASRLPVLVLDNGANGFTFTGQQGAQPAGTADIYTFAQGMPSLAVGASSVGASPIPIGVRFGAGFRIRTSTGGLQVGDQWTAPTYLVREWIEGA